MSSDSGTFPWTEEQWARARKAVQDSARRTRVASSFLPLFGPLPADQVTVQSMTMKARGLEDRARGEVENRLVVDDRTTIPLTTISADLYLRTYEAADPEMTAALSMIGRAAVVLARLEDSIVFNGQPGADEFPTDPPVTPHIYKVSGGEARPGLLDADNLIEVGGAGSEQSSNLVEAVVTGISSLEADGHYGPFALVLGDELYAAANRPSSDGMVLPSDRIKPFLDGPLLRSSVIPAGAGVMVALAGDPIDLVVAHDLDLKLVQMTLEPRYVLRLSERFTLRIKQDGANCVFAATNAD